jgi:hypothetical protein
MTISPPDQTTRHTNEEVKQQAFAMPAALQEIKVNMNVVKSSLNAPPSLEAIKPFLPLFKDVVIVEPKRENVYGLAPAAPPLVLSNA